MKKKVIIIGAGLTGLSAGITLQKKGIESEIFEMAPWAGGVCTAWTRLGFSFDGCIHWMIGTRKGEPLRKLYESVSALYSDTVIYNPEFITLEIDNIQHDISMNLPQFESYLLSIAPEDKQWITKFCRELRLISRSIMVASAPSNMKELFDIMLRGRPFLSAYKRHVSTTVGSYTKEIQSEMLRKVIHHLMSPSMSLFALIMMLGTRMSKNGGFPMGGAKEMIERMTNHYVSLGGKLHLNSKVDEIVVEDGFVKGIISKDTFYESHHVVAACDMYDTLNRMLKKAYPHEVLNKLLEEGPLFHPVMLVSYGLSQKFGIPYSISKKLHDSIKTSDTTEVKSYLLRSFEFEESFAPNGKSSVMVMLSAPFDYWHDLKVNDASRYMSEKLAIANQFADQIDQDYPGFKSSIEVIDVATPSTYYRLNNLYKGSYEGFLPNPEMMKLKIKPTIDGVENLWLAGQWMTPGGGIPPSILGGIKTAKQIAKKI
jgi:phytoene dehydrogenase-like protein